MPEDPPIELRQHEHCEPVHGHYKGERQRHIVGNRVKEGGGVKEQRLAVELKRASVLAPTIELAILNTIQETYRIPGVCDRNSHDKLHGLREHVANYEVPGDHEESDSAVPLMTLKRATVSQRISGVRKLILSDGTL